MCQVPLTDYNFLKYRYSLLQFITMPMIGSLSDVYGRKVLYLVCLVGISLSYLLWNLSAGYFSVFVLFRTLGGLSKGNISLSTAIVTDVSTEKDRGKGFALIGIAFSLGFIVRAFSICYSFCNKSDFVLLQLGPLLGAWMTLGQFHSPESCFQSFPPLIALTLSLANLIFSYLYLPETLPISKRVSFCVLVCIKIFFNKALMTTHRRRLSVQVWKMRSTTSIHGHCSPLKSSKIYIPVVCFCFLNYF